MTDMGKIVNSHTVRFERRFPGPIEKIWEYFSTEKGISEWLCGDVSLDARLNGRIELRFPPIGGGTTGCNVRGIIHEYDPPRLIAFSWNDTKKDLASTVKFELKAEGEEVLLVLTHSRISPDYMPRVAAGWHTHLEGLIAALRSEKLPEVEPLFTELLKKYTGILAGVVVSAAISPSITSAADQAYKALSDSRQQLLMQYEKTWKAADELENQVDELKHEVHADRKHTNADLDRTLKRTYDDLLRIEQDMRDLNKSAVK